MSSPIDVSKSYAIRPKMSADELKSKQEGQLKQAANMYEQHFLQEMVKAMRKTVSPGWQAPSFAEKIYSEQLDSQYVGTWSKKGGIGLADVIYNQIHERIFPQDHMPAPKGPLPVAPSEQGGDIKVRVQAPEAQGEVNQSKTSRMDVQFNLPKEESNAILAPWKAEVAAVEHLDSNQTVMLLNHLEVAGLQSRFAFCGRGTVRVGDQIESGDPIGQMSAGERTLNWAITRG